MRRVQSGAMSMLALDCSTDLLSVAVRHGDRLWALDEVTGSAASQRILPVVMKLLDDAGLAPPVVSAFAPPATVPADSTLAIALGAGPGSFTGLRIACGVVQGLALAWGCPVVQVSSFEAVAAKARALHGDRAARVWVALDARMGEVYLAALEAHGETWTMLGAPEALPPAAALARIQAAGDGFFACGSGFSLYPALAATGASTFTGVDPALAVDARVMIDLAQRALAAGQAIDPAQVAPLYVRDKVALTIAERRERSARAAGQSA